MESPALSEAARQPGRLRAVLESILVLYLYYAATVVFLILPPLVLRSLGIRLGLRPGTVITLGGVLLAELAVLWAAAAYYRRRAIRIGELGWQLPRHVAALVVASLVVAFFYTWVTLGIPDVRENLLELSLFKFWGILVAVPAAFIEEIIFRGYLMARLQQARMAPTVQLLLAAVAFSLLHLGFGCGGILCTFLVGIALGGLYLLGQRNLLGPLLCHGVINAALEPWLLLWMLKFYSEKFAF